MNQYFDTVLIANRGEIAVRIMRTLRTMGIRSAAVYSEADVDARHVREADVAVLIGPAAARDSYLSIDRILEAASRVGADAIHPGYGFLSENSAFASACNEAGIVFIGPSAKAIAIMGDKITAKNTVMGFGVAVVPGISRRGLSDADLITAAHDIGYPILVKPSAGGGGKGMHRVAEPAELAGTLLTARREAASAFGDDTLFLERFVSRPRHIEVQILGDRHGNIIHLGERECSLQRRHQKVVEEAPSPLLDEDARMRIGAAACESARSVAYEGAGTVEFIVSADRPDEFFFMEMNTRLQVEHAVTEMVTGLDLVEWQVRVAAGEALPFAQSDVKQRGHAIEARVYAEDPARGFLPTGGVVAGLHEPSGEGVRVDSGLLKGSRVGPDYDPMLAKIITHKADRPSALAALDEALADTVILGMVTNLEFLRFLLRDEDVRTGRLDTELLDRRVIDFAASPASDEVLVAAAAYRWLTRWTDPPGSDPWDLPAGWRIGAPAPTRFRLQSETTITQVAITGSLSEAMVTIETGGPRSLAASMDDATLTVVVDGLRKTYWVADTDSYVWLAGSAGTWRVREAVDPTTQAMRMHVGTAELVSGLPGTVIAVSVETGANVIAGAAVVVVEAMKMEHPITTPIDGTVDILVAVGDQVKVDQLLARVVPAPGASASLSAKDGAP